MLTDLHPHPSALHLVTTYRRFILGMKKKFGTARSHTHYKQIIQIYLEAKRELLRSLK